MAGRKRTESLPNVQAGNGAADDHALDLRGALEDREDVRPALSRAACMLTIMHLACQETDGR
jgi:hypothetical protein